MNLCTLLSVLDNYKLGEFYLPLLLKVISLKLIIKE